MNKVRQAREARELNQRQLSELSHTPQALVSAIERGVLKPWPSVARRLSKALRMSIEELFPDDKDRLISLTKKR